jgi:pimeloyl-ACP methyl ester carboxylesterase
VITHWNLHFSREFFLATEDDMKAQSYLAAAFTLLGSASAGTASPDTGLVAPPNWDPNNYKKSFASCSAVDRSGAQPRNIRLKLAYLDLNKNKKKTLILVHGWPSLWTTYRHQITEFSDYRLIIPEIRGYGDSEHPKDLYTSNTMFDVRDVDEFATN